MLSSIIGSGIISIPYSAAVVKSVPVILILNIFCILAMLLAARILLKVRENVKRLFGIHQVNFSDLSYLLFGRIGMLLVNGFIGIALLGFNVLF